MPVNAWLPDELGGGVYRSVFQDIAKAWHLRDGESCKLIPMPTRMFQHWSDETVQLSPRQRDHISHLANIHVALSKFRGRPIANSWIRRSNAAFNRRSPLDVMMNEGLDGIASVRSCLEQLQ